MNKKDKLTHLEDIIGEYNDLRIVLSFLNEDIHTYTTLEPALKLIQKKCYANKKTLRQKIQKQLNEFSWS